VTRRPARPYESELVSLLGNSLGHLLERKRTEQQLAIARDQALEASRFKSQLLAKVSHELRTPLGSAIGYAELLQNNILGPVSDEQKQALGNIIDSGNYLNLMINELLDQAQIESKSVKLRMMPFSPSELLSHLMSIVSVLATNKHLACGCSIDPALPETLYGDSKRIQQIVINLTGNAIKFTAVGEVRLDILYPDPEHWSLRVSDTGPGIPAEAQTYIFEPFRQTDSAITSHNRGIGLGLSITKQLVELMGGKITLESEVNKGSIFTVILPILRQPPA
jgi:signal transduction histidine kinase